MGILVFNCVFLKTLILSTSRQLLVVGVGVGVGVGVNNLKTCAFT